MANDGRHPGPLCVLLNATLSEITSLSDRFWADFWLGVESDGIEPESGMVTLPPLFEGGPSEWVASRTFDPDDSLRKGLIDEFFMDPGSGVAEVYWIMHDVAEQLEDGVEGLLIPPDTQKLLMSIANYPVPMHIIESTGDGPVVARLVTTPYCEFIVEAVRSLWSVLMGDARLLRCPAPAPRPVNPPNNFSEKCDRWFVNKGGQGRPRKYCSDTCAKRASRWGLVRSDKSGLNTDP